MEIWTSIHKNLSKQQAQAVFHKDRVRLNRCSDLPKPSLVYAACPFLSENLGKIKALDLFQQTFNLNHRKPIELPYLDLITITDCKIWVTFSCDIFYTGKY